MRYAGPSPQGRFPPPVARWAAVCAACLLAGVASAVVEAAVGAFDLDRPAGFQALRQIAGVIAQRLDLEGQAAEYKGTARSVRNYDDYGHVTAEWNYDASGLQLRITVIEAPEARLGFLAVATY